MARMTLKYTLAKNVADIFVAKHGDHFDGYRFERVSDTEIEIYNSKAGHYRFESEIGNIIYSMPATEAPATEKQIAFLGRLIANDPGAATTIGASRDGSTVVDGLTKAEASRMISAMLDGI